MNNTTYPNPIHADRVMMDALSHAEKLAFDNPQSHAVVYRQGNASGESGYMGGAKIFVRLANEEAPEGAHVVTTVSRKPAVDFRGQPLKYVEHLGDAVRYVMSNLPVDTSLHPKAVVNRYPAKRNHYSGAPEPQGVFSYDFMTSEGLNIATWIPAVAMYPHVQMQLGFEGRGRPFHDWQGRETQSIERWIDAAHAAHAREITRAKKLDFFLWLYRDAGRAIPVPPTLDDRPVPG